MFKHFRKKQNIIKRRSELWQNVASVVEAECVRCVKEQGASKSIPIPHRNTRLEMGLERPFAIFVTVAGNALIAEEQGVNNCLARHWFFWCFPFFCSPFLYFI